MGTVAQRARRRGHRSATCTAYRQQNGPAQHGCRAGRLGTHGDESTGVIRHADGDPPAEIPPQEAATLQDEIHAGCRGCAPEPTRRPRAGAAVVARRTSAGLDDDDGDVLVVRRARASTRCMVSRRRSANRKHYRSNESQACVAVPRGAERRPPPFGCFRPCAWALPALVNSATPVVNVPYVRTSSRRSRLREHAALLQGGAVLELTPLHGSRTSQATPAGRSTSELQVALNAQGGTARRYVRAKGRWAVPLDGGRPDEAVCEWRFSHEHR